MTGPDGPRLIYSMGVSMDGYVADRDGEFAWTLPDEERFRDSLEQVSQLGACLLGRKLYESMLVWEPVGDAAHPARAIRDTGFGAAFADAWTALPKVVFSRTLNAVQGNARLASATLEEEVATALAGGRDVQIGGAELAWAAFDRGLIDELRITRCPVVVGGGTPLLPPVQHWVHLDLVEARTFSQGEVYERYRVVNREREGQPLR